MLQCNCIRTNSILDTRIYLRKNVIMKTTLQLKKYRYILIVCFAIFLIFSGAFTILSSIAVNQYWSVSHLQDAVIDISDYENNVVNNDNELNRIKKIVHSCNEKAIPMRQECTAFFNSCNDIIIRCLRDIYGVDATEKLDQLQVMESTYPEDVSQWVGGSYTSDFPSMLFINTEILDSFTSSITENGAPDIDSTEFSAKMLRTVYIHEVMHYLGIRSDSSFNHFTEALAESLNEQIMQYSDIQYESITGYNAIQDFAAQIIACDPAFITEILNNSSLDIGEYFNQKLGGDYAKYYDKLIGLLNSVTNDKSKIAFYTQYLTYEYCKAVNDKAKDILNSENKNTVNFFELKWFLNID